MTDQQLLRKILKKLDNMKEKLDHILNVQMEDTHTH